MTPASNSSVYSGSSLGTVLPWNSHTHTTKKAPITAQGTVQGEESVMLER